MSKNFYVNGFFGKVITVDVAWTFQPGEVTVKEASSAILD